MNARIGPMAAQIIKATVTAAHPFCPSPAI